jgi:hypothetical protein
MGAAMNWRYFLAGLLLILAPQILPAAGSDEKQATFFVGRLKFSDNDGDDCSETAPELARLVSRASTIQVQAEKKVRTVDESLYDTPFLFMNGHNDFVLSAPEIENLRKYLTHGGFIMGSGCCTNPEFPTAWRREFSRIFPGSAMKNIPYDHLIYRSFYKMESLRSVEKSGPIYLEGLFYKENLVAVMCQDGLCCSFAMDSSCNDGHGIPPEEAKKIALNIAVFALTH